VPGIQASLFSIPQAVKEGYAAVFEQGKFSLYKPERVHTSGRPVLQGEHKHGVYKVEIPIQQDGDSGEVALLADVKPANRFELWHRRLGHSSTAVMKTMLSLSLLTV
jgi:hypothetical protein